MSDWTGLEIQLERDTGNIITVAQDARETEIVPINSASGYHQVNGWSNLYDGNWHNILYTWSCDDRTSFPNYSNENAVNALRQGVLVVDAGIIANTISNPGKQTPFTFIHDWTESLATFITIGARAQNAACTSYAAFDQVIQPYAGMISSIVIWDRVLGPDYSTNIDATTNELLNGLSPSASFLGYISQWFGESSLDTWDPLTGSYSKVLSSNVIAYWKFNEMSLDSTSATDWASISGNGNNTGGIQDNPEIGNPINWYDVQIEDGDYELQDISDPNEDGVMKTGLVAFEDANGNKRQVGFINYDLGFVVLDGEFSESGGITGVPFLRSIGLSGMSTNKSLTADHFYVKKINFTSQEFVETLVINVTVSGFEMNQTENSTGIEQTTGGQLLNPNITWPQSVGLYNEINELVGIAKFSSPIRKDEDHNIVAQIKLDFSGAYPTGVLIQP